MKITHHQGYFLRLNTAALEQQKTLYNLFDMMSTAPQKCVKVMSRPLNCLKKPLESHLKKKKKYQDLFFFLFTFNYIK